MITIFRRHLKSCKFATKGRKYRACGCPIAAEGRLHGEMIRASLDVRNWEAAQKIVRDWEVRGIRAVISVGDAYDRFIREFETNGSAEATIGKHRLLKRELVAYFGDLPIHSVSLDDLAKFRETWKGANITLRMKIARLRSLFKFAVEREWIDRNPAQFLKLPPDNVISPKPYEPKEIEKIEKAIAAFPAWGIYGEGNRVRVKAFISVLRWTGLRIGDVVRLKRDKVKDGRIVLRAQKNGKWVSIRLHPEVEKALKDLGGTSEYLFWSGEGKPKSAVSDWQRTLKRLGKIAKVNVHAHRYRHTLAAELLSKGISITEVAAILGDSPRIIEKSYSHWILQRQTALDKAIEAIW